MNILLAMLSNSEKLRFRDHVRHFRGIAFGTLGFCTRSAICKRGIGPEWIEVVNIEIGIKGLPDKLKGKRIVHLSDIHCSRTVSKKYLRRCIKRVNKIEPDIVALTGDYVTHDIRGKHRQNAVDIIGKIKSKYGVFACLGNHDYGPGSMVGKSHYNVVNSIISEMTKKGIIILRNESVSVNVDGERIGVVGLGDLWANDFHPQKAFEKVPGSEFVMALVHNPEGIDHLHALKTDIVLAGHTHGTTVDLTFNPKKVLRSRRFHAGLFEVGDKKMYVNRGLGRLGRTLFNARPEITVITLT